MQSTALILFDDDIAGRWEPFALTRPAGELIFGAYTLRERAERVMDAPCALHIAADHLRGFREDGAPPVGRPEDSPREVDRLFLLSRAIPAWTATNVWRRDRRPGPIRIDGTVVGWFSPAGELPPAAEFFRHRTLPPDVPDALELPGRVLENVWELVSGNSAQITADVAGVHPRATADPLPPGVLGWGDHPVILEEGVSLEPGCALDTSAGPIWIARGAVVRAFTRLSGPAYIGRDSHVLGGTVSGVSIGPVCRVRGEMSATVCLGYTNKQHDGHIGRAYLGRWVNIGAGTNNSDLKNNYSPVRMWTPDGERDTGEIKLGSLLGDHVKTGIGLLINTGTVVGAGSNLYGAEMPPKFVPPFSWGTGSELIEYRLDKFLEVADRAMMRRDVHLSDAGRQQLRAAWERGRSKWGTGSNGKG